MSDETKWTKGPWVWGKYGSIEDANGELVEATGLVLTTGYRDPSDPAFANAHLIAAAPDMADALMCWPLSELLGMVEDSGDAAMRERAKWFMEVRDFALAKARGES